jgi:hypothetical protein
VRIIVQYSLQWGKQELDFYVGILPTSENCLAEKLSRRKDNKKKKKKK